MDKRNRQVLQDQSDLANQFASLKSHPAWATYIEWLSKGVTNSEIRLSNADRSNHVELVRALEAADVYKSVLADFERVITAGIEARKKLQEDSVGAVTDREPVTGRKLS